MLPKSSLLVLLAHEPRLRPPPEGSLGEEPVGVLRMVDGRVIYGRAINSGDEDTLGWETMLRDRIALPLDEVRSISTNASEQIDTGILREKESTKDRVILENGDELIGFLLAYRPMVEIETHTGVRTLEPQRVRSVTLANPAKSSAYTLVALADGSVIACESIASTVEGNVVLTDADTHSKMEIVSDDLVGILWQPEAVVGLVSLAEPSIEPGEQLRWITPPAPTASNPLGIGDLWFKGPTVARWPLPKGAQLFGTTVELPASTQPWGACEVAVLIGSRGGVGGGRVELASVTLDAEHPHAELLVDLSSAPPNAELLIEVRAGRMGPVEDRPILRAPMILLSVP